MYLNINHINEKTADTDRSQFDSGISQFDVYIVTCHGERVSAGVSANSGERGRGSVSQVQTQQLRRKLSTQIGHYFEKALICELIMFFFLIREKAYT